MALYPSTVSDRMEPEPEPERTPAEWMDDCAHCEACLRVLGMLCYAGEVNRDVAHWEDDAARILGCGEDGACDLWED